MVEKKRNGLRKLSRSLEILKYVGNKTLDVSDKNAHKMCNMKEFLVKLLITIFSGTGGSTGTGVI